MKRNRKIHFDTAKVNLLTGIFLISLSLVACHEEKAGSGKLPDNDVLTLRRSDIVLSWGGFNEEACEKYGVTVWGWGPSAMYADEYEDVPVRIEEAYDRGMRLVMGTVCETIRPSPSDESFTEFRRNPELMNSACRDIAGNPMTPSWWDIDYGDGNRSYWNCANNPAFREFFIDKAVRVIQSGADGLFIDGILSNRQIVGMGGCFCDHCTEGFRKYLEHRYNENELVNMGINDIGSFDYRTMVREVASDFDTYMQALWEDRIPLLDEFRDFQMTEDTAFIKEVIRSAKAAGENVYIPAAGNACMLWPDWVICGEFLDFFVTELDFWSEPGHMPVLQYKIASALDKPIAAWPIGPSVGHIKEKNLSGMLKQWVALSYAMGGNFMIPHRLWASTHESGSMSVYNAPFDEFVPLYRFVQDHAGMFDGYQDCSQVGLLYSNNSRRMQSTAVNQACWELLNSNIPFSLALAEDKYVPAYATMQREDLSEYELLLIPGNSLDESFLSQRDKELVSELLQKYKAMFMGEIQNISRKIVPLVSAEKGRKLWVLPRRKNSDPSAPVLVHVINNNYDRDNDRLFMQKGAVISISKRLFEGNEVKGIEVFMPGEESSEQELAVEYDEDGNILVTLPEGKLWWLIKLELDQ